MSKVKMLHKYKNRDNLWQDNGVEAYNKDFCLVLTSSQQLGIDRETIISCKHININEISLHDGFIDLQNPIDMLQKIEVGVYSMVDTQWDTTSPTLCKNIKDTIEQSNEYTDVEMSSNMDEFFESSRKPGATLVGVLSKWASRAESRWLHGYKRWCLWLLSGAWSRRFVFYVGPWCGGKSTYLLESKRIGYRCMTSTLA